MKSIGEYIRDCLGYQPVDPLVQEIMGWPMIARLPEAEREATARAMAARQRADLKRIGMPT